ncbi:MAG: ABC transporter substrate-binding protein [Desulfarculaceae bacterium]|nr:ABC transporter substrate-binding protein [Desulfarculaceae bacterium]MCF8072671.1 ABC transporter substrate-binding protein [Desulfarculaceae bacterium]MCF8102550.1 ABC transporter substrate-binding protein [Desulfarculaceae bacterium]MCF8116459.1 ABC transporter substrate-binding protein [Desulfarculaceae bacterium]
MKRILIIAASVLLALALAIPAVAADPVKIGVLVPLTGIVANGGKEMANGIDMAAKDKKTLLGRPIKLIVEDTRVKPAVAVSKAEKLVYQDKSVALIGVFSSGVGLALAKNIDKLNVPFVSTHVMTTKFYGLNPLVFRSGQLANDQTAVGNVEGILATPDLKKRKYYVLVHDYSWGHDAAKRFIALAKAKGVKVVNPDFDRAPIKTKNWSTYISKIKASGADGIYIALITDVIPRFMKQANEFGLMKTCRLVSGAAPGAVDLENAGTAGVGIFGASDYAWDLENFPGYQAKAKDWNTRYYKMYKAIPCDAAAHSYVGAMNLFKAIEKAGSTDPQKIAAAIRGISYDGPYGKVYICPGDNCMRNDAVLTETVKAPKNPYGATIYMKVLKVFPAKELGPPCKN